MMKLNRRQFFRAMACLGAAVVLPVVVVKAALFPRTGSTLTVAHIRAARDALEANAARTTIVENRLAWPAFEIERSSYPSLMHGTYRNVPWTIGRSTAVHELSLIHI
ncbi:MAG TPA: hypothetical protein ENH62_11030, partial [Marinobacter sp.]|nr:hypothetical protein [Marinobacter sp.]